MQRRSLTMMRLYSSILRMLRLAQIEGFVQTKLGKHEAAIADHDEALRLNPDLAIAYHNRGLAKLMLGKEHAVEDFDQTIRLHPQSAIPYWNRAMAKSSLRQYEAAIADYDETIRRMPEYAGAYAEGGMLERRLKHNKKARGFFDSTQTRPQGPQ